MADLTYEEKQSMYRNGEYKFSAPPVSPGLWEERDWIAYIDAGNGWLPADRNPDRMTEGRRERIVKLVRQLEDFAAYVHDCLLARAEYEEDRGSYVPTPEHQTAYELVTSGVRSTMYPYVEIKDLDLLYQINRAACLPDDEPLRQQISDYLLRYWPQLVED